MKKSLVIIVLALFVTVIAGTWDAWWHGAIGRDSFWEPPHILLYSSVMVAIITGIHTYLSTKRKEWRNLAISLVAIPISAPFDEFWHRLFGIEDISSPLIVWSLPHLTIVFSLIISICLTLKLLSFEKQEFKLIFGSLLFASLLNLGLFLLLPLQPEGAWHLVGFAGAGFMTAIIVGILLFAQKWIDQPGSVFFTTSIFLSISAISFNEKVAEGIRIIPHEHAPAFLVVFSFLLIALMLETINHVWIKSMLAGAIWSLVIYGFSWIFFKPEFAYGLLSGVIAVMASIVGAFAAAWIVRRFRYAQRD